MNEFIHKYGNDVISVLSGFDRLVLRGTLRPIVYAAGMMNYLYAMEVLLKDFQEYVEQITKAVKEASTLEARQMNRPIVYLQSSQIRKESVARKIMEQDRITDGLICVLSCVEPCISYAIRRDRETTKLVLEPRLRKCLHLYHYRIDEVFGFMSARVQTWFPFSMQLCLNGREWLARRMDEQGMEYRREENCFVRIDDFQRAQRLMDEQLKFDWTGALDRIASLVNPVHGQIFPNYPIGYYWSAHQSEWATDVLFSSRQALSRIYPLLVAAGISTFSSPDVMRFLGKKLHGNYAGELISDYKSRPEGIRVKHRAGANSVKMYDKQGRILRVETTLNDPKPFKVFRPVEGDPHGSCAWRPMRAGIADLPRRAQISRASNNRYLDALASLNTDEPIVRLIDPVCRVTHLNGRRERALRPWAACDQLLLKTISRGEFVVNGFRNRDILACLCPEAVPNADEKRRLSAGVTRKLRLLRAHRIIKKLPKSHRYSVTAKGRRIISAIMKYETATLEQLEKAAA